MACTGSEFCNLAVVETKQRSADILAYLEREVRLDTSIMVSVSGCPNSCAQYQIADIGLTGIPAILPDGKKVDGFNLFVGGCLGESPRFGVELLRKVPAQYVQKVIAALVRGYMANRIEDTDGEVEPFRAFVSRLEIGQLRQLCTIDEWIPAPPRAA